MCVLAMVEFVTMMEPRQIGDPKPMPGPTHPSPSPLPSPSPKPGGPGPTDPTPTQPIPPQPHNEVTYADLYKPIRRNADPLSTAT